jgi:ADP-heptose:LPS heptosyltransferase
MVDLLLNGKSTLSESLSGTDLIRVAVVLWLTNIIVFALAFFELDQGGPFKRRMGEGRGDFQFPQQEGDLAEKWPNWRPTFVDYLYLSFTNSTSFSPTDTMPLSHWAKLAMMLESASALVTIGVIAARAVNILN